MPQIPSGLFDTGAAGVSTDDLLASVDHPFLTLNDTDIFGCLDTEASDVTMATREPFMSMSSDGDGDPFPLDASLSVTDTTDFCEVFTDLSSLLQETEMKSEKKVVSSSNVAEVSRVATKRKATDSSPPASAVNSDHADYTIKSKRQKTSVCDLDGDDAAGSDKDEKYLERRMKNNVASRRSRETRKQKHSEMEVKAQELEKRNDELRKRVTELEKLTKEMKEILVQKLAAGK